MTLREYAAGRAFRVLYQTDQTAGLVDICWLFSSLPEKTKHLSVCPMLFCAYGKRHRLHIIRRPESNFMSFAGCSLYFENRLKICARHCPTGREREQATEHHAPSSARAFQAAFINTSSVLTIVYTSVLKSKCSDAKVF